MTEQGYGSTPAGAGAAGQWDAAPPWRSAASALQDAQAEAALAAHQERERRWHNRDEDTNAAPSARVGQVDDAQQWQSGYASPASSSASHPVSHPAEQAFDQPGAAQPAQPAPAQWASNNEQTQQLAATRFDQQPPASTYQQPEQAQLAYAQPSYDAQPGYEQPAYAAQSSPAPAEFDPAGFAGAHTAPAPAQQALSYQQPADQYASPPPLPYAPQGEAQEFNAGIGTNTTAAQSGYDASPTAAQAYEPSGPAQHSEPAFSTREASPSTSTPTLTRPPVAFEMPRQASSSAAEAYVLAAPEGAENEGAQRVGTAPAKVSENQVKLVELLQLVLDSGASDLHITTNVPPTLRLHGELHPMTDYPVMTGETIQTLLYAVLTQKQRETFENELELDFAYTLPGKARFRVNIYRQRNHLGAAFRLIPFEIKPLEALGVPPSVAQFASLPRGFVLVTGPTGSGKSTTLASLVDLANRTRKDHILTVEDPIEFLHEHRSCVVNQREVGEDTHSFAAALKHALRQDPDIILVGELRDLETISVALTAAETGHLVFATLHTQDAPQTIDRLIDVFPAHQQEQIRVQLAGALQGVVTQTLCKTADGMGRAVATEVLVATAAVRNLIREGKVHQIHSSMQAGAKFGMHTLDQHLADLVKRNRITMEVALEKCRDEQDLRRLLGEA